MTSLSPAQTMALSALNDYGDVVQYDPRQFAFVVPKPQHRIKMNTIKSLIRMKLVKVTERKKAGTKNRKVIDKIKAVQSD